MTQPRPGQARSLSAEELTDETGVGRDRLQWMTEIGILKPSPPGAFRSADVLRVKLVSGLLEAGFTTQQVEWAVSEGHLNLDRVDEYQVIERGPRSTRPFADFIGTAGPQGSLLPSVYSALGLPRPDPSQTISTDEEERLQRFLEGWAPAGSDETLLRAARLVAEGTRLATQGWGDLFDEQVVGPTRERLFRGELERFPDEVRVANATLLRLLPRMVEWLIQRYNEQRTVASIVEGFEGFFASRGMEAPRPSTAPPAVVFVDLSGYTRLTEERGDEVAVGYATILQREAEAVATSNEGRLVKLLGDGAMLRFPDAERGLRAALTLVRGLSVEGGLPAHAGVHAGPVIERDLDLFGRTVNLASRLAGAAGPGEVLATQAVKEAVDDPALRFEPAHTAPLKGILDAVALYRVTADRDALPS
jgi:class 3 adenylate cyclase